MAMLKGLLKGKGLVMSILLLHLFTFSPLEAQQPSIKEKINAIKTDTGYLWESCTWLAGSGLTEDSVFMIAANLLRDQINNEAQKEYTLKELLPFIGKKKIKRGRNSVEVFVYAHKDSISGAGSRGRKDAVPLKPVTKKAEPFTPLPLAKEIMAAGNIEAAWNLLRQKKGSDVIDCGSMKQVANVGPVCLAIFSREDRTPVCVLSPVKKDGKRQNLIDGSTDSLERHRPCHAIWFTVGKGEKVKE